MDGRGSLSCGRRLGREASSLTPFSAKVKNKWICTFTLGYTCMSCTKEIFTCKTVVLCVCAQLHVVTCRCSTGASVPHHSVCACTYAVRTVGRRTHCSNAGVTKFRPQESLDQQPTSYRRVLHMRIRSTEIRGTNQYPGTV
jgi:hypothetical protein